MCKMKKCVSGSFFLAVFVIMTVTADATQTCRDKYPQCPGYTADRCKNEKSVRIFCKKTCGLCDDQPKSEPTLKTSPSLTTTTAAATGGTVLPEKPEKPVATCKEAKAGQTTTCTCTTSDLGQPPGRLVWLKGDRVIVSGQYGQQTLTVSVPVTAQDNGRSLICRVEWQSGGETEAEAVLSVIFPPAKPRIPAAPSAVAVGDQHNITCFARGGSPLIDYIIIDCYGQSNAFFRKSSLDEFSGTGTFNVSRHNPYCICTAHAPKNNAQWDPVSSEPVNMTVYLSPETPRISTGPSVVYEGDQQNVTCSAEGGKPPVDRLTIRCYGQSKTFFRPRSAATATFNVSRQDPFCECTARAPRNRTVWNPVSSERVSMTVYRPPSVPKITLPSGALFRENGSGDFLCKSDDAGNPPATYEWVQPPGRQLRRLKDTGWVRMNSLTWEDNGLEVRCRAENNFTTEKGKRVTGVYRLNVLYDPVFSLRALDGNECGGAENGSCTVPERGRIHVNCSAHGNPPVTRTEWSGQHPSSPVLDITASRQHSSFRCYANNGERSFATELGVSITYAPDPPKLVLKSSRQDVNNQTVDENSRVTLECTARGRPGPSLRLQKVQQSQIEALKTKAGTAEQGQTALSHRLEQAKCQDAGRYQCVIAGHEALQSYADLSVQCKPRLPDGVPPTQKNITYTGSPVPITFDLIAYPPPTITVTRKDPAPGQAKQSSPVKTSVSFNGTCETKSTAKHVAVCTVWIEHATSADSGTYTVTAENSEGKFDGLIFSLIVEEPPEPERRDPSSSSGLSPVIAAGIAAIIIALVVVAVIVVVFVLRKRREKTDDGSVLYQNARKASHDSGDDEVMITSCLYGTSEGVGVFAFVNKPKPAAEQSAAAAVAGPSDFGPTYGNNAATSDIAPQTAETGDVYATVIKPGRSSGTGKAAGTGKAKGSGSTRGKPEVKPKPGSKTAPRGSTLDKAGGDESVNDGRQVNADGLIYVSPDFANYTPDPEKPPPAKETVDYVAIDFRKSGVSGNTEKHQ